MAQRIDAVEKQVQNACLAAGRSREEVQLITVSKSRSVEEIKAAYDCGVRVFGESRVQELAVKAAELPDDIEWHFIGKLQSNKAKKASEICNVIHTIENEKQIRIIAAIAASVKVFIQVNLAQEEQKSGVLLTELDALLENVIQYKDIRVLGLMTIGPVVSDAEDSRPLFRQLAQAAMQRNLKGLSMGMSDDFAQAIQEGSTHVRVGTAIFGPRMA